MQRHDPKAGGTERMRLMGAGTSGRTPVECMIGLGLGWDMVTQTGDEARGGLDLRMDACREAAIWNAIRGGQHHDKGWYTVPARTHPNEIERREHQDMTGMRSTSTGGKSKKKEARKAPIMAMRHES